mgnify:CR=1 FL=1
MSDPIDRKGLEPRFWEKKPLAKLSDKEWEALCDGCGKCCLNKLEDEDTGQVELTCVACRLFDDASCRCSQYEIRHQFVPECISLTPRTIERHAYWLPETCAYRRRAEGEPLPRWHYLLTGSREDVHLAGAGAAGRVISETKAGPLEHHIVEWSD